MKATASSLLAFFARPAHLIPTLSDVVTFRLAQPLRLSLHDAGPALQRLLADTRCGAVSAINLPDECLVRMIRRHDRPSALECVMTWEPATSEGSSFIGSLSVMKCGRSSLALVLDGMAEIHRQAELQDERLARASAEAVGRSVLERVAGELAIRGWPRTASAREFGGVAQRPMSHAAPMLHTANARSAKMG